MNGKVVIKLEHLRKVYGSTIAVEEVSIEVYEGEIFGMVGPNGAGKTTTTECVEGLRDPDGGEIQVFGMSPQKAAYALRERIGVQLQTSALQERFKVWEALDSPENLIRSIGADNRVVFAVDGKFDPQPFSRLPNVTHIESRPSFDDFVGFRQHLWQ